MQFSLPSSKSRKIDFFSTKLFLNDRSCHYTQNPVWEFWYLFYFILKISFVKNSLRRVSATLKLWYAVVIDSLIKESMAVVITLVSQDLVIFWNYSPVIENGTITKSILRDLELGKEITLIINAIFFAELL